MGVKIQIGFFSTCCLIQSHKDWFKARSLAWYSLSPAAAAAPVFGSSVFFSALSTSSFLLSCDRKAKMDEGAVVVGVLEENPENPPNADEAPWKKRKCRQGIFPDK